MSTKNLSRTKKISIILKTSRAGLVSIDRYIRENSSALLSDFLLSLLLWTWGGTVYFFMEVIYKTIIGHSSQISWTMIIVAFILCIPLERCGDELPWEMPMYQQTLICAIAITGTELISGIIINICLGMNVWDYSNMPFNFLGQICPQFFIVWIVISYFGIKIFDWIRFHVAGGIKPSYSNFKRHEIDCSCVWCKNEDGEFYKVDLNHKDDILSRYIALKENE